MPWSTADDKITPLNYARNMPTNNPFPDRNSYESSIIEPQNLSKSSAVTAGLATVASADEERSERNGFFQQQATYWFYWNR